MRALDLCAGAGGLSLGLQRAGFEVRGVELDADSVATHRAMVGPCDHSDLWLYSPCGPVDLAAAGLPCQPHSMAGNKNKGGPRGGSRDKRGQLYVPFFRIANEAQARAVLIENVRGLGSSPSDTHANGLEELLDAAVRAGFEHTFVRLLDAADFSVPQNRLRLFLVAFRSALDASRFRWPCPSHFRGALLGSPWVTVGAAVGCIRARTALLTMDARQQKNCS